MNVVAFGISTAFGTGQAAIQTALRDGREAMALRPDIIGSDYRPQLCLFAPNTQLGRVAGRVMDLIADALHDLTQQLILCNIDWPTDIALVLLTPGADIGHSTKDATALSALVEQSLRDSGWLSARGPATLLQGGAGTTAQALSSAAALVATGRPVLLVTADSYACRIRMAALLDNNALFSSANPWGFVPGEAACAALILPEGLGVSPQFHVTSFAETIEPVPERLNKDSTYIGMTDAALAALKTHAALGLPAPEHIVTDWNNSRYRAAEFSYTLLRLTGLTQAKMEEIQHPTQRFGQCGAAWLSATIANRLLHPGGSSLILCGNEADGVRSAFVVISLANEQTTY